MKRYNLTKTICILGISLIATGCTSHSTMSNVTTTVTTVTTQEITKKMVFPRAKENAPTNKMGTKTVTSSVTSQPTSSVTTSPTTTTSITTKKVAPTTSITTKKVAPTTTTKVEKARIEVKNCKVTTISVSCLKVTWDADEDREYKINVDTKADYKENIHIERKGKNLCYITGLRENSNYLVSIEPEQKDNENVDNYIWVKSVIEGHTEKVTSIYDFEKEEGWTNCFCGERASGLTAMPSSGAIYGSINDPITDTGIRRNQYGDYCCAMGLWYGTVGDRFLVELENGIQFTVAICDSKGWADDADGDGEPDGKFHWFGGFGGGKCIIEFIYDNDDNLPDWVEFNGSWGGYNWNGLNLGANINSIKKLSDYGDKVQY